MSLEALTPVIDKMFGQQPRHFWGLSVWKDWDGFHTPRHVDNTGIDVSMQVYLGDDNNPGTVFYTPDGTVSMPYQHNSGYILWNREPRLPHESAAPVPQGSVRHSLYSIWSQSPKYVPNAPDLT